MSLRRPPRDLVLAFVALLVLLGLTVTLAYQPLGRLNTPLALVIATFKGLIVALVFMELWQRRGVTIAAAVVGVGWLGILIWLASTDFALRAAAS
jgi:cytochrome c oxidase subunit 4